jgi:hypothetical protein
MWSQLAIGWQWSRPDTTATTTAVVVMSIAMLAFLSLALLAAMPIGWTIVRQVAQHRCHRLVVPSWLFIGGSGLLVVGARHFGNGWPGTGGRQLPEAGIIPGGLAAFVWASTLSITSYWAHPFALLSFPVAEVSWMVVSPVAIVCVAAGAAMTVRRLDLSPRALRFEARLASATCFSMAPVLTC